MKRRFFSAAMGILMATVGVVGMSTTPASAASLSRLNNGGGNVPVYFAPNTQHSNVKVWAPNNTKFRMICWLDNAGHRWFYGQEHSQGSYGYATAGVVKDQIQVGSC